MSDTIEEGQPILATIVGYPAPVAGRYITSNGVPAVLTDIGTYVIESILEVGE